MPAVDRLHFEDLEVGFVIEAGDHLVTKEEIISFAEKWDRQPFHIDEELAKASHYGGLIACSAHIFAILCSFSDRISPPLASLGALGFDAFRIHAPLRPGARIRFVSRTASRRRSRSKPDRGIVVFHNSLYDQDDLEILSIRTTVMMRSRDSVEGAAAGR
jgi:acyl dehydratase